MAHRKITTHLIFGAFFCFGLLANGATSWSAGSELLLQPDGHFIIRDPAQLTPVESMAVYDQVSGQMLKGYSASKDQTAIRFRKWKRHNSSPYNSPTHGNRYINNYANAIAEAAGYGEKKSGKIMPVGSIIAKDSFTVTKDRKVYAGALFIMEKLPPGKSPETGDWRYQMIMPDGSLFGDTQGTDAKQVSFCHSCHKGKAEMDFLFFIPKQFRR